MNSFASVCVFLTWQTVWRNVPHSQCLIHSDRPLDWACSPINSEKHIIFFFCLCVWVYLTGSDGGYLTFIPAKESMLLTLYWPDWTGVVYSIISLNCWEKGEIYWLSTANCNTTHSFLSYSVISCVVNDQVRHKNRTSASLSIDECKIKVDPAHRGVVTRTGFKPCPRLKWIFELS